MVTDRTLRVSYDTYVALSRRKYELIKQGELATFDKVIALAIARSEQR